MCFIIWRSRCQSVNLIAISCRPFSNLFETDSCQLRLKWDRLSPTRWTVQSLQQQASRGWGCRTLKFQVKMGHWNYLLLVPGNKKIQCKHFATSDYSGSPKSFHFHLHLRPYSEPGELQRAAKQITGKIVWSNAVSKFKDELLNSKYTHVISSCLLLCRW